MKKYKKLGVLNIPKISHRTRGPLSSKGRQHGVLVSSLQIKTLTNSNLFCTVLGCATGEVGVASARRPKGPVIALASSLNDCATEVGTAAFELANIKK